MKFIVDRKTWYRGKKSIGSRLLREDGMRCCIGFVGQQCGLPDRSLLDKISIAACGISVLGPQWPDWMKGYDDIHEAYETNDDSRMPDTEREAKLKELFARNGDEIEFIN